MSTSSMGGSMHAFLETLVAFLYSLVSMKIATSRWIINLKITAGA